MKRILWIPYPTVIILIRVFLGLIFFGAGMSKLYFEHKFPGIIGPVWLEDELTQYGLGMYARFIACAQVITGLLLFSQRFATLGALLLFPILQIIRNRSSTFPLNGLLEKLIEDG